MLVKEANAEYTMLSASEHWDPHGKTDNGAAPEVLYTKAELNTVVQKQVSAALKQMSNGNNKKSSDSQKSNDVTKITNKMTSQINPMSHVYPSKPGKPNHQILVKQKSKKWVARLGIGVNIVVLGACHMEPKIIRIQQPCHKQHHPHLPPPSQTWSNMDFSFLGMSCSSMNSFLAGFLCGFSAYFPHLFPGLSSPISYGFVSVALSSLSLQGNNSCITIIITQKSST